MYCELGLDLVFYGRQGPPIFPGRPPITTCGISRAINIADYLKKRLIMCNYYMICIYITCTILAGDPSKGDRDGLHLTALPTLKPVPFLPGRPTVVEVTRRGSQEEGPSCGPIFGRFWPRRGRFSGRLRGFPRVVVCGSLPRFPCSASVRTLRQPQEEAVVRRERW